MTVAPIKKEVFKLKLGSLVSEIIRFIICLLLSIALSFLVQEEGLAKAVLVPFTILVIIGIVFLTVTVVISSIMTLSQGDKGVTITSIVILVSTIVMTVFNVTNIIKFF